MQMEIPDTSHMFSSHAAREFGAFPHHSWSFPESEWPDGVHSMKMDDNGDGAKFNSSAFPWASINEVQRIRGGSCVFPASPQMNGLGMKEYFGNGDNLGSLPNMFHQRLKLSEPVAPAHGEAEGDEFFGSMEELESHAIGKLLPDDEEDLLADVGYSYERVFQASSAEEEFDLFDSGGGMELEGELQNAIINGYQIGGGNAGVLAGEHPYGEHPSRTLFVRNINSNVEDAELRALFEQYGAIRTLYTACKHRGFVMISYYDIRAARTAMRALQNKPLRRRKLDIHFSIPKDNPSDKDVNQGTLVVFNLDASVSNDDLRQIFGVYGEIKEIRETPHKKHHKFIEFYDVRAAEAALRALNRSDIAGKRIKLEPSRPGGARRSLMQQLTHELEQEEFRCQQQLHASLGTSPPGHSSQWGSTVSKLSENGRAAHPISHGTFSSFGGKPLNGVVGSLPARVSSPLRNGITSNQGGHSPLIQADRCVGHLSLRVRPQLSSLPPSDHDSPTRLAPSFAPQEGLDGARLQRSVTSIRDYSGLELSPRVLGLSPGSKSGQQLLWSSPSPYYHQMQNSPPIMYSGDHGQGHFASARANLDFSSNIHVGSGPFAEGVIDGQNGYFPELSDRASLPWSGSLDGFRLTGSNGSHVLGSSHGAINLAAIATTKGMIDSPRLGVMSPLHRARSFSNPGSLDGFSDRGKSRRVDSNAAQAENKKYQLDLDRILRGEDSRTTLMIKNIPNKYTSKMLLSTIDEHHRGTYDFIYLPIDFKNKCNVGYAFINMIAPAHIVPFFQTFNGKKWEKFNSEKVASLAYARIQGKVALIAHFQNSSLMNEDKRCRPILFHSEGPNLGDPEPFPVGSNVRTRPGRERNGICHLETSSSSSSSCSSKDDENGEHDLGQSSSDVEKD